VKKNIKFFLWIVEGIILVIISSGIIILTLDPNQYKNFIAGKISKKIGRQFEISRELKIQYYPWLRIEASEIILGNAKGFEHSFFKADSLTFRIKTLPLLKKQIAMDTLSKLSLCRKRGKLCAYVCSKSCDISRSWNSFMVW